MSEKSAGILPSCGRGAVAVLFLFMASMAPPAVGAAPPPYRYDATHCNNSYYFVPTTAARARAEVPAQFGILGEEAGLAIVGVLFITCDVSLNGGTAERTSWSDVGVLIVPPGDLVGDLLGGSITIHAYRAWSVADRDEMVALNAAWGIDTRKVDVDTAYAPGLPVATSVGYVDDCDGAYGGQGYFEGIVHPGAPGVVTWWTVGSAGVVRFDQAYTNDTEQCGVGAVTGEGRMGTLIGGSGLGPHGCVVFADLTGIATLVGPAP